jgi:hypothetical protein
MSQETYAAMQDLVVRVDPCMRPQTDRLRGSTLAALACRRKGPCRERLLVALLLALCSSATNRVLFTRDAL